MLKPASPLTSERWSELSGRFSSKRIAVVGDFFLDKYLGFDPGIAETSLETGQTAHQVTAVRYSPGAAGASLANVVSLGAAEVIPVGFCGDDGEGYELKLGLGRLGCSTDCLVPAPECRTPAYLKPHDIGVAGIAGERERYDIINRQPLPARVEQAILKMIEEVVPHVDAVLLEDQVEAPETGVLTSAVRLQVASLAERFPGTVFWADSRRRIGLFRNVILKPNQFEGVRAVFGDPPTAIDEETASAAATALAATTGKPVFLTRGDQGMLVADAGRLEWAPAFPVRGPIDPTGAGASASAAAVLALVSGATLIEAAMAANLVGSITVEQIGKCGVATRLQVANRLEQWVTES